MTLKISVAEGVKPHVTACTYLRPADPPLEYLVARPRMVVSDVVAAVEFLREVFAAVGEAHPDRPGASWTSTP
jgi:hypothetical protein